MKSPRLGVCFAVGALGALISGVAGWSAEWTDLLVLGAAVAAGEILELRTVDRAPIPLSYAIMLVLARTGEPWQAASIVVGAQVLALFLRSPDSIKLAVARADRKMVPVPGDEVVPDVPLARQNKARLALFVERTLVCLSAVGAYRGFEQILGSQEETWEVLCALAVASLAMLVIYEMIRMFREQRVSVSLRGRSADIALVSSGMLMAIGYHGINDKGQMGAWALGLFSIPLIAAWYSFERLHSSRQTYWQTIEALSMAPELGGLVMKGHSDRVADLCVAMAVELDLTGPEIETLRAAALLHHIGQVCMDDPEVTGKPLDPVDISQLSAAMLRDTGHLAEVGDVVADEAQTFRSPGGSVPLRRPLTGQILKIASTYDEIAHGDTTKANSAMSVLYSAPAYVYDPRVLAALERVLAEKHLAITV